VLRAAFVLRRLRGESGRDLQGCSRWRARLEPDHRQDHEAHGVAALATRPRPGRRRRGARVARPSPPPRRPAASRHRRDEPDHDDSHEAARGPHHHDSPAPTSNDDAPDGEDPLTVALTPLARQRRHAELALGLVVAIIAVGGYILVALANGPTLPPGLDALLA